MWKCVFKMCNEPMFLCSASLSSPHPHLLCPKAVMNNHYPTPLRPLCTSPLSPHPLFNTLWRVGCVCVCINVPEHHHCMSYVWFVFMYVCTMHAVAFVCGKMCVGVCAHNILCVSEHKWKVFGSGGAKCQPPSVDIIGEQILIEISITSNDSGICFCTGEGFILWHLQCVTWPPKMSSSTITGKDLWVFTVILLQLWRHLLTETHYYINPV